MSAAVITGFETHGVYLDFLGRIEEEQLMSWLGLGRCTVSY